MCDEIEREEIYRMFESGNYSIEYKNDAVRKLVELADKNSNSSLYIAALALANQTGENSEVIEYIQNKLRENGIELQLEKSENYGY